MLNSYLNDTALLLNDPTNQFYTQNTLTTWINRARRWLSIRTMYPRVLVTTLNTVANQETYAISLATAAVAAVPGVLSPYGFWGISVQQGNYFIALGRKDFPSFQADDRILDGTLQNYPIRFSSYARGAASVAYMFPVPAAIYAMWWDLACLPIDLVTDATVEAIPEPFQEIVPFLAARYAVISQQRWQDAQGFANEADQMLNEATAAELPFMRPDWYPQEK